MKRVVICFVFLSVSACEKPDSVFPAAIAKTEVPVSNAGADVRFVNLYYGAPNNISFEEIADDVYVKLNGSRRKLSQASRESERVKKYVSDFFQLRLERFREIDKSSRDQSREYKIMTYAPDAGFVAYYIQKDEMDADLARWVDEVLTFSTL